MHSEESRGLKMEKTGSDMKKAFYAKPYTIQRQKPIPRKRIRISRVRPVINEIKESPVEQKQEKDYRYHCPAIVEIDGKAKQCEFKSDRWRTMQAHILGAHTTPNGIVDIEKAKENKGQLKRNSELIKKVCELHEKYPLVKQR